MDDLISRQAAIGIVEFECGEWRGLANTIVKAIEQLPSAQPKLLQPWEVLVAQAVLPQPKMGKWIDTGGNEEWYAREYRCSECGDTMLGEANFCPNCGADMRGEQDG